MAYNGNKPQAVLFYEPLWIVENINMYLHFQTATFLLAHAGVFSLSLQSRNIIPHVQHSTASLLIKLIWQRITGPNFCTCYKVNWNLHRMFSSYLSVFLQFVVRNSIIRDPHPPSPKFHIVNVLCIMILVYAISFVSIVKELFLKALKLQYE